MKRAIVLAVALMLMITALGVAQTPAPEAKKDLAAFPPSKAKVYAGEVDLQIGYLPNDASVSHSYWLHSRGEDSLKILRVKPACGCTKAPLKKEVIAVGDSGEVELVFHASAGQKGNITKSATVTCNDNDKGNFQLRFGAVIYAQDHPDSLTPLTLSQSMVKWDQNSKGKEQIVTLKNVSTAPVMIKLVTEPHGYAVVDLGTGDIKPGKTRDVKIRVAPEFTGQDFTKSITFECNDAAKTRYSVPVVLSAQIAAVAPPLDKAAAAKAGSNEAAGGSH